MSEAASWRHADFGPQAFLCLSVCAIPPIADDYTFCPLQTTAVCSWRFKIFPATRPARSKTPRGRRRCVCTLRCSAPISPQSIYSHNTRCSCHHILKFPTPCATIAFNASLHFARLVNYATPSLIHPSILPTYCAMISSCRSFGFGPCPNLPCENRYRPPSFEPVSGLTMT